MKKSLIGALALVMTAALFVGCGKKEESPEKKLYVTLPEYKGIELNISLTDEEVEMMAAQLYFDTVSLPGEITDRAVRIGDLANIDYEGKKDGVAFAGGTAQGAGLLIGSGQFIEGFEDGLIGVMPGETVDLNLRFPDGYGNAELAGQDVVFTVKVNYLSEMEDSLVPSMEIEDVATIEQLKQYIKKNEYRERAEQEVMNKVMEMAVYEEFPQEMLDANKQLYADWLEQMGQMYGVDGRTLVSLQGMDYDSLLQEYAIEYTEQQVVVEAIAEQEGLIMSDKDLDTRISEYAENLGLTVEALYARGATRDNLRQNFMFEDVMDCLVESAVNIAEK